MSQIHAPYHFVPLSKWVYMPDWAHLVSHDVPFEDGFCGKINYTLTNATELIVGGEQQARDGLPALVKWARDPQGNLVVPGSSIKGMLRNVLEIASFGKFSHIDDEHYSYRDISNAETVYQKRLADSRSQAYWLKFDEQKKCWTLTKTKHTVLFHDEFNQFNELGYKKVDNIPFKQPAEDKYRQWPLNRPGIDFDIKERSIIGVKGKKVNVSRATNLGGGKLLGHPVFSGFRPGPKRYTQSRLNYSYIFYGSEEQPIVLEQNIDDLANRLFANHDEKLVNYLKKNPHPKYGIPVFARLHKQRDEILAFGFAQMPRMLYDYSVLETAKHTQKTAAADSYFDLAELMFGCLREKGLSLKSRVSFTDAKHDGEQQPKDSEPVILGQPKASYLNAYLEQPAAKDGVLEVTKTTNLSQYEQQSVLAGWKRYPSQQGFKAHLPEDVKSKVKVQSQLELLSPDNRFSGQIVFHNLKAEELGALLWILRLGETADGNQYYHGLGHAKALGAGAVQFKLDLDIKPNSSEYWQQADNISPQSADDFIQLFVEHMNGVYPGSQLNWQQSPQLTHLLAFAQKDDNGDDKKLRYMPLSNRDKFSQEATYTSSVKGRRKLVLPAWRNQGKALERRESVATEEPSHRGQGRLYDLLPAADKKLKQEMQQAEQQRQAVAAMSSTAQLISKLQGDLKPYNGVAGEQAKQQRQGFTHAIDELLDQCLNDDIEPDVVNTLYQIAQDPKQSGYLDLAKKKKDNKLKLQQRKAKLAAVADKYRLELNL